MGVSRIGRRRFLREGAAAAATVLMGRRLALAEAEETERAARKPNLVFVFADQWRAQATGYAGDPNAHTPNLDRLASESLCFTRAVAGCPVCSPYRASLLTGQYPLTHGVFLNDVRLSSGRAVSIADVYNAAGYHTAYIGKWHLDGSNRGAFIPRERRQGFQFWRGFGCTHNYPNSPYYADDDPAKRTWEGYDAIAQTREAEAYIRQRAGSGPFVLFLSWGPPHNPYGTAPQPCRERFADREIRLRPNVPASLKDRAETDLRGYYAHLAALDECIGALLRTLRETGLEENTLFVFTSDHGDMLFSQGQTRKQRPWDESILVPLLVRCPAVFGTQGRRVNMPVNASDLMPTLLGLSGLKAPDTVEGTDFSRVLRAGSEPGDGAALIACYAPFGEWTRQMGGREYRGVRTARYTYVRTLEGPWLLYDNQADPYQQENLCSRPEHAGLQAELDRLLSRKLEETRDKFLPADEYIRQWGYKVDSSGTVPCVS
jgi:arylsulfatase A-like enzyme